MSDRNNDCLECADRVKPWVCCGILGGAVVGIAVMAAMQ